jgi:hypothetical protein
MSILRLAISIALAFTFSCSSGGGGNDGGDGSIVNANNEAWLWEGGGGGIVIKQNGEFLRIYKRNGYYCIARTSTYSISGNQITVCMYDDCSEAMPYSISGNKLTIIEDGHSGISIRTSGINISGDCTYDKD